MSAKPREKMTYEEAVYTLFLDGMDTKSLAEQFDKHEAEILDMIHAERAKRK